jgi:uncharacterized cupredoxin-like copper-binding protein
VLLLALSTSNKVGLALAAAIFAGFSLVVSMLVPRWRPQFPGRGLPLFLVVCVLLFLGMMAAMITFGKESEEAEAAETTETTTGELTKAIEVSEVDFKIKLPETSMPAGVYTFDVSNDGNAPHDLVIEGNGLEKATPEIAPGGHGELQVELKPGTYEFYCSIPGHKQLGMDVKVTVS